MVAVRPAPPVPDRTRSAPTLFRVERGLKIRTRRRRSPAPDGSLSRGASPVTTPSPSPGLSPPPSRSVTPAASSNALNELNLQE
mmetsp:Transcript_22933/g.71280  ORF Transcript_22933/g.71280 Transcript_22933/m.71280 type:complete len:84 (+) Transcript_22933:984-1235(+)